MNTSNLNSVLLSCLFAVACFLANRVWVISESVAVTQVKMQVIEYNIADLKNDMKGVKNSINAL